MAPSVLWPCFSFPQGDAPTELRLTDFVRPFPNLERQEGKSIMIVNVHPYAGRGKPSWANHDGGFRADNTPEAVY